MAKVDLRKLKDQATRALEKKQYARAAELYVEIALGEPGEPDWRQRAGEALRKVPDAARAIVELEQAAEGYAHNGFLLKAIAVCKVVLQLDPRHQKTQTMLAELYARREGRGPSGEVKVAAPVELLRTRSGELELAPAAPVPPSPSPPRSSSSPPRSSPPPLPPDAARAPRTPPPPMMPIVMSDNAEAALGLVDAAPLVAIDERPPAAAPPATAPLDVLPLHEVLGGRKSQQFFIDDLIAEPAAYEISLDDALELDYSAPMHAPLPTIADFADVAPPPRALPTIPLLSSLTADELRTVIERVEVREHHAGDAIVRQGEAGGSLFILVRGRVRVVAEPDGRTLGTLGEGAFFGELALLTNFPRSATVVAEAPTQLLEISRELVAEIVQRSPDVLKTLLRFFRDRLVDRLLGASPLFASFPPDDARALADRFLFLELEPGMRVIAEGERAPGLFLLLCGDARVLRGGGEVAHLAPGDVFGEMSLLTRGPATATIETRSKCWALELPRERFQEVMVTYPQMLEYVSTLADARERDNGPEERVDFF